LKRICNAVYTLDCLLGLWTVFSDYWTGLTAQRVFSYFFFLFLLRVER